MSLLHSALTTIGSQDNKPSSLPQTTKELQTLLESGLAEGETEGEVITIYISPPETNGAASSVVELDESTRSVSTSETEAIEDSPKPLSIPYRDRNSKERYVGDFTDVFSGGLRIKWNNAKAKVDLQRKKIKCLQQRNRRLKNRIVQLKSTLKHLHGDENTVTSD